MTDNQPLRTPEACEPPPGLEVWRLRRGQHLLICEVCDVRVGVHLLSLDGTRWPVVTQPCASLGHAEFVAMRHRRGYLRQGWTEQR